MCFLSQETSKTFLNGANRSTNFELFMKASQLETVRQLLEKCSIEHELSLRLIDEKQRLMAKLEDKLFECERSYKRSIASEALDWKVNFLRKEHLWACVRDGEIALNKAKQRKVNVSRSISDKRKKLDTDEEILSGLNSEIEVAQREIEQCSSEEISEKSTNNYKDLERKVGRLRNEISKLEERLQKKVHEKLEFEEKLIDVKNVTSEIEEYKLNIRKREDMIESTQGKMSQNASQISTQESECSFLKLKSQENCAKIQALRDDLASSEKQILELEKEIKSLAGGVKNRALAFGDYMPGLLNDIQNCFANGRFKTRPLGK